MTLRQEITDLAARTRQASFGLATLSTKDKDRLLENIAGLLQQESEMLLVANEKDLQAARAKGISGAMLDRLTLSLKTIEAMADGVREVCKLPDPVGAIEKMVRRPNGLQVGRMRVPLGVVAMIYESRPNVTIDAAILCLKAGNGVILRGGSEAIHSNLALAEILRTALRQQGLDENSVQLIPTTDREAVLHLLKLEDSIDLVIPRGGEGLIRFVCDNSTIPVLKHYKGVCHIYVDKEADLVKALPIIINAKTQRPGVCNAMEGLLVHRDLAAEWLPQAVSALRSQGVVIKGCPRSVALCSEVQAATESDWGSEFLELQMCLKIVESMHEAIDYIRQYGSSHTECILTENYTTARQFVAQVDASAVVVNASTRFNDGGELGLGAEIGISTSKLHAYGPMGLEELTARKFVVFGEGQIRT